MRTLINRLTTRIYDIISPKTNSQLQEILDELRSQFPVKYHNRIFIVGGLIRDFYMGKTSDNPDIDLVMRLPKNVILSFGAKLIDTTSAAPVFLLKMKFTNPSLQHCKDVQIAHPRKEKKTGFGYHGFEHFGDHRLSLKEDMSRRSETIGALAISLTGKFYDYHNGKTHVLNCELRHVSPAFIEDPVRVFRMLRLSCNGFTIADKTKEFIQNHDWHQDFLHLPVERIWTELEKAFHAKHPERFFENLWNINVGHEFFPELFAMPSIPSGPEEFHPERFLNLHVLDVLSKVSTMTKNPVARFAAFYHDHGKIITDPSKYPTHHDHDSKQCAEFLNQTLKQLKVPNIYLNAALMTLRFHMKAVNWKNLRAKTKLEIVIAAKSAALHHDFPFIVKADSGTTLTNWSDILSISSKSATQLGINTASEDFRKKSSEDKASLILQFRIEQINQLSKE
jgi:tRNA nucleotidyltransferase (CCA-adding enzyme)